MCRGSTIIERSAKRLIPSLTAHPCAQLQATSAIMARESPKTGQIMKNHGVGKYVKSARGRARPGTLLGKT